jgi:hypothetical protein
MHEAIPSIFLRYWTVEHMSLDRGARRPRRATVMPFAAHATRRCESETPVRLRLGPVTIGAASAVRAAQCKPHTVLGDRVARQ